MARQNLILLFDRAIDKNIDFISPGGYEVKMDEGESIQFDFVDYYANIDDDDKSILHVECRGIDIESFPEAGIIAMSDVAEHIVEIVECYIYSAMEGTEDGVILKKILEWSINDTPIKQEVIDEYNKKLTGKSDDNDQQEKPKTS